MLTELKPIGYTFGSHNLGFPRVRRLAHVLCGFVTSRIDLDEKYKSLLVYELILRSLSGDLLEPARQGRLVAHLETCADKFLHQTLPWPWQGKLCPVQFAIRQHFYEFASCLENELKSP